MNMTLSEAIRLGSLLHPQYFDFIHGWDAENKIVASCALGSAQDAGFDLETIRDCAQSHCPLCGQYVSYLPSAIAHLNDIHRLTRDRIADLVEVWEHEQEASGCAPVGDPPQVAQEVL